MGSQRHFYATDKDWTARFEHPKRKYRTIPPLALFSRYDLLIKIIGYSTTASRCYFCRSLAARSGQFGNDETYRLAGLV